MNAASDEPKTRKSRSRDRETIDNFSEFIKNLREAKGWTQEETAERLDLSQSYYANIELGKRNISLGLAMKICAVFHTDLQTFLETYYK